MPASRKVNKLTAIRKRKVRNLFEKPVCFTVIWIVIYVEFMLFWVYQALFFLMFFITCIWTTEDSYLNNSL